MQLWGYVPDYDVDAAYSSALANVEFLTGLTVVRFALCGDGSLTESRGFRSIPEARRGLPVVPLIANQVNGQWAGEMVAGMLGDPGLRQRHVQEILERTASDSGVEIDYEALPIGAREAFSVFVEDLAAALHGLGKQLSVAVHAKLSEPGEGDGPAGQDWSRIGAAVDRVAVMTYDHDPARPGPISPLAWVRDVLLFAVSQIPATKVVQGIPLYGYRWAGGEPPSYVTHLEFSDLAREHGVSPRRDGVDRHLVLQFREGDVRHEAWISDAETAVVLAALGREIGVAGYAAWRLGGEDVPALGALAAMRQ